MIAVPVAIRALRDLCFEITSEGLGHLDPWIFHRTFLEAPVRSRGFFILSVHPRYFGRRAGQTRLWVRGFALPFRIYRLPGRRGTE
jgi:hypothetical protein